MPPSGYSSAQASYICSFLESCSGALKSEARERGETLLEALRREVAGIDRVLPDQDADLSRDVLALTATFYRRLHRVYSEEAGDFDGAVESVLGEVTEAVLKVHVPGDRSEFPVAVGADASRDAPRPAIRLT